MPTRPLRRPEHSPDGASGGGERPGRRGRHLIAAAALGLLIGAVLAAMLIGAGHSPSAQPGAIQGSATTVVKRRDLVETDTETGTLGYREALNVYGRLGGTVTCVPRVGAVIYPGQVLYRVEGAGVYLFDGATPARRTLRLGMRDGADVGELNRDLRAMGYDPNAEIELGDHFSEATKRAVERWQAAHGLAQTGEIEFGRVVFQPGPRRIEKVNLSLGGSATPQASSGASAGLAEANSGSGAPSTGNASCQGASGGASVGVTLETGPRPPVAATPVVYTGGAHARAVALVSAAKAPGSSASPQALTTSTTTTASPGSSGPPESPTPSRQTTSTSTTSAPKTVPPAAGKGSGRNAGRAPSTQAGAPATGGRGTKPAVSSGGVGSSGKPSAASPAATAAGAQSSPPGIALVTTSLQRVVTVPLEASKQAEARVGEPVQVTLPSAEVIGGHITNVASAASAPASNAGGGSSSAGTSGSTVDVEISLDKRLGAGALDQVSVSVAFAAQRERGVLSIPVTALVATGSGGYAVDEVQGVRRRLVPVTPGLYGGGFVEITGVPEGTVVTNASQ